MPNNITNRIEFSGDKENIKKVLELIKGEDRLIDFDKIIPMPKSLRLPSGSDQEFAIKCALSKKSYDERRSIENALKNKKCSFYGNYYNKIFGYHRDNESSFIEERAMSFAKNLEENTNSFDDCDYAALGIKNFEDLGNAYLTNIIEYGYIDWYDWSCDNWGTKWNAYDIYVEDDAIEFDTAWACPIEVLDKLAELCYEYDVSFTGKWADEDCGHNTGTFESDCDDDEYYFNYEYAENGSSEAYAIYVELKGENSCLGQDEDGNWIKYDCENCPNADEC